MSDGIRRWKEVHEVLTPGGDPVWECPVCGDKHLYGVETPENHKNVCSSCGANVFYPWEKPEEEKLKPCQHCGSLAIVEESYIEHDIVPYVDGWVWKLYCDDCHESVVYGYSEQEAIKEWNKL